MFDHTLRSEAIPVPQKKAPLFSEQAQIVTVDTLEGLLCTHEVYIKHSCCNLWLVLPCTCTVHVASLLPGLYPEN